MARLRTCVAVVVVPLFATLLLAGLRPEALLPLKLQVAVGLLGWRGFFHTVSEKMASRVLGTNR